MLKSFKKLIHVFLVVCLLVSTMAINPVGVNAETKNPLGGICPSLITLMSDAELDTFLNEFDSTNALYVRIDLPWSVIQPDNSTSWNFTDYDRVINAIVAKGLKLLVIPTYCPSWANGGYDDDKYPPTAAHATDWYNFVKACADRYVPLGVDAWEMWNEPNITGFWRPVCNVANYTNIVLKNGSDAVRASAAALGKTVTVVSGGLSPAATDGENIHPLDFLEGIYANGGKTYMDAIGHHPYCFPESPYSTVVYSCFQMTPSLYQIMVDNGDGAKKIWGTEFGYHTGNSNIGGVTQALQAQYVTDAYTIWNSWSYTGPLCWYDYQDLGTDLSDREQCFGLKLYNGTNKPSWQAYKNVMAATMPTSTLNPYTQIEAENYSSKNGTIDPISGDGGTVIENNTAGDYMVFNNVNFGTGATSLQARVATAQSGVQIQFRLDSATGPLVGTIAVPSNGWDTYTTQTCTVTNATGTHNLYAVMTPGLSNINWFKFIQTSTAAFVKGINFAGNGVTIDGNAWLSYSNALSNGFAVTTGSTSTTNISWSPTPINSNFKSMLDSQLYRSAGSLNMTQTIANGTYQVYMYTCEDAASNSRSYKFNLEGLTKASSIGTMAINTWQRYGPYNVTVTDGVMNIDLVRITGDTQICGLSIFTL